MNEIKRKYVLPGDKIVEGNYRMLANVIKIDNSIHSTRIGIAEISHEGVKVIPLSGVYIPRVGDIIIGKIVGQSVLAWEVDINSCFYGYLPAQDVFDKDFNPSKDDMRKRFNIGDLILCKIVAFDRTRDPLLTVAEKDLGKIKEGEVVKISPTKIPRLIGKRGSMIQTIEQYTKCNIIIGQNGIAVVQGSNKNKIELTIKAIKAIEREAHTANLTQRIKEMLEREVGEKNG